MNLYSIEKILLSEWDPIGIMNEVNAKDEYHAYATDIANMITHGATTKDISDALLKIERDMMGLNGDTERADRVAQNLLSVLSK